ncbi:hypothetical protein ACIPQ1_28675 [Pseudomonas sp. LARHCG127]|uniref:hypothetical protein n=1 Tax=unclassified Pseudomonas TaxID=196821 RepID=UPI0039852F4E
MSRESVADFVAWLEQRPRTLGWDAIVAYDQSKANTLLRQEYIQRFDSGRYFDPLTFNVQYSPTHWDYLYDYILDAPRLSFETSDISNSKATLTMRIVGGKQVTVKQAVGERVTSVTRIGLADALNGPLLHMLVPLERTPGTEDSLGRVTLDLSKGGGVYGEFYLTVGDGMEQDWVAAEKFRQLFEALDDDQKVFELNSLARDPSELLRPEKFYIRTHPAPGGNVRGAPNFGEGEVLVFIQMRGGASDDEVGFPPSNAGMHYLIPQDGGSEPLSATILLGNRFLLKNVVADGFKRINAAPVQVASEGVVGEHIRSLTPQNGARTAQVPVQTDVPSIRSLALPSGITLPFKAGTGGELFARINKDILILRWEGQRATDARVELSNSQVVSSAVTMKWHRQQSFRFSTSANGQLSLAPVQAGDNVAQYKVSPNGLIGTPAEPHLGPIIERLESLLRQQLDDSFQLFTSSISQIDAFRLDGLLFRTQNSIQPSSGYFVGDLALLGKVAPSLTNFLIAPIEPVVGPGGRITFSTQPAVTGLTWSVKSLPGESGDSGEINRDTGVYVAPGGTDITGYQKRVLVTARAANGNSSKALVSIVKSDINIDPLVFVVTARSEGEQVSGYKMSAAALDGTELVWKLASGSTASIENEPEPIIGLPNQKRFIPPVRQGDAAVTLEYIEVSRISGGRAQQAVAVVIQHASSHFFRTVFDPLRGMQLKLVYVNRNGDEIQEPIEQTTFTQLYGDGSITEAGWYVPSPNSTMKFAVCMAERASDEDWKFACIILPLPLL